MKYVMTLYLDYREHGLISRMKVETKNLILGDAVIEKDGQEIVIVERKTVSDLVSSICDGRYQEQSFRLLESTLPPHRIVYVIEGSLDSPQSIPKKSILSSMMSLWFKKGFTVIQTATIEETVTFLEMLLEKTITESSEQDYVSTIKIKKKDKLTPDNIGILMLSQIPTISTITATVLLKTYGTVFGLTQQLKENPHVLDTFTYGEKPRKLSKKSIENLITYLHV